MRPRLRRLVVALDYSNPYLNMYQEFQQARRGVNSRTLACIDLQNQRSPAGRPRPGCARLPSPCLPLSATSRRPPARRSPPCPPALLPLPADALHDTSCCSACFAVQFKRHPMVARLLEGGTCLQVGWGVEWRGREGSRAARRRCRR